MAGAPYGAIDLGGTKILAVIATDGGQVLARDRRPTPAAGPDAVLDELVGSLRAAALAADVSPRDLRGVGIACPGPLDLRAGVVSHPPNLPGWEEVPLRRLAEERLGVPVVLENDATAAAIGEHAFGAGRGAAHMVYVTVGTGIGGGVFSEGRPSPG